MSNDLYQRYLDRHPIAQFPSVPFNTFLQYFKAEWQQGEHVAIVGPTGCGKTTVLSHILSIRQYVVIFVTKTYDEVLRDEFPDFERMKKWNPKLYHDKILLWPDAEDDIIDTYRVQRKVFKDALNKIFKQRGWTIVFDEQYYMTKDLRLGAEVAMYLHQGRSSKLTVVNGTQRPAHVPVVTYSSSTHAILWDTNFKDDLKRLAELGGVNARSLEANLQELGKHEFIYVNCRTGATMRSQAPAPITKKDI